MLVKILKDSISEHGVRIVTFHLRYWRAIHAELMTHRAFGRNARSSRAVPTITLLTEGIFIPQFGMNKPGMQSDILASPELQAHWAKEWQELADITKSYVKRWGEEGMHKQHANRPLEWFGWIDVQVTATKWNNFWALRISDYAQPEFNLLASAMKTAMDSSTPELLGLGQWHLPWIDDEDRKLYAVEDLLKLSVARSARLSYKPFDGQADYKAEMERYDRLVVSQPVHASPAEHQATPDSTREDVDEWAAPQLHGNLHGWIQYRKTLASEHVPG